MIFFHIAFFASMSELESEHTRNSALYCLFRALRGPRSPYTVHTMSVLHVDLMFAVVDGDGDAFGLLRCWYDTV